MNKSTTPKLSDIIFKAIEAKLIDLHTSMPGEVVSFNASTKRAVVKPVLMKLNNNGKPTYLPPITDVPVYFPQGANCIISIPVKAGDTGMLVFAERSIDSWKMQGGTVSPGDVRRHNLSDAVFFPGIVSAGKGLSADADAIKIQNGNLTVYVYSDGKIKITNGSVDFISKLIDTLTEISNATVMVSGTPMPLLNKITLTADIAVLQGFLKS